MKKSRQKNAIPKGFLISVYSKATKTLESTGIIIEDEHVARTYCNKLFATGKYHSMSMMPVN